MKGKLTKIKNQQKQQSAKKETTPVQQLATSKEGFSRGRWAKLGKGAKTASRIFGGLKLILSAYFLKDNVKKEFQSEHEKFIEKEYSPGILIPGELNLTRKLIFKIGSNSTAFSMAGKTRIIFWNYEREPSVHRRFTFVILNYTT